MDEQSVEVQGIQNNATNNRSHKTLAWTLFFLPILFVVVELLLQKNSLDVLGMKEIIGTLLMVLVAPLVFFISTKIIKVDNSSYIKAMCVTGVAFSFLGLLDFVKVFFAVDVSRFHIFSLIFVCVTIYFTIQKLYRISVQEVIKLILLNVILFVIFLMAITPVVAMIWYLLAAFFPNYF